MIKHDSYNIRKMYFQRKQELLQKQQVAGGGKEGKGRQKLVMKIMTTQMMMMMIFMLFLPYQIINLKREKMITRGRTKKSLLVIMMILT